jgi:hypothetical protein
MEIKELLKDKVVAERIEKWSTELLQVFEGKAANERLTKETAEIGLLLLDKHPALKAGTRGWILIEAFQRNTERYQRVFDLVPDSGWTRQELEDLLIYFFGVEKARYVAHALEKIRFEMYQTGYARRSFRAPENRNLYFINQLNFLIGVLPQTFTYGCYPNYEKTFYELNVSEQVRHDHLLGSGNSLFRLWSAALDLDNHDVFQLMEDIIFNKDEIGKVTRNIIKALLNSTKKEAWELVEKLLLAAQRQEGLRQTILEALDETSVGALKYLIEVIIDHKLTRFSSVVRSVDVWAGLGWESERESTVRNFLEKAHEFLAGQERIPAGIRSSNNTDVYMALWAQGVLDVERTAPLLSELYERGNSEKRGLALKFAIETQHEAMSMPFYYQALEDSEPLILAWALRGINELDLEKYQKSAEFPLLFEKLHRIVERIDPKEKTFDGKIFAWTRISLNRNEAVRAMIALIGENDERLGIVLSYFNGLSVHLREQLTRHILKGFMGYLWDAEAKNVQLTDFQRAYAFKVVSDKSESIANAAFLALDKISLTAQEMTVLESLLKRKGAIFRGKVIGLLLKQTDKKIKVTTENLLISGDAEQRLAGLDIALQLRKAKRLESEIRTWAELFRVRKTISAKEEILLSQLTEAPEKVQDHSFENGYGLWDQAKAFSPVVRPVPDPESFYERMITKNEFGFSVSVALIKEELEKLGEIYLANKDFEYEVENWNNSKTAVLLGNTFRSKFQQPDYSNPQELYESYPLPEVWEKWYQDSGLQPIDLYLVGMSNEPKAKNLLPFYNDIMPDGFSKRYYYQNPLINVVDALLLKHPFAEKYEFLIGGCVRLFSLLEEKVLQGKQDERQYYSYHSGNGWQSQNNYHTFYYRINAQEIDARLVKDLWNLENWRQFSGKHENAKFCYPTLATFCRAFEQNIISDDEMYRGLMTTTNIQLLTRKRTSQNDFDYFERFPFLRPMFERVREHILDIEMKRGDSATDVSPLVASLNEIYGASRFVQLLIGLGKTTLNRGYTYYGSNYTKQALFSRLLKNCYPAATDTQEVFNELVKRAKLSEAKLIEAAVYAPQWQKFISHYLNWKGLDSAIWWMHAHTKIAGYREPNAEAESEIAKYSSVDLEDFKNGAVDKDWFLQAYKQMGKARWELVYAAAKFISEGNGHRRARLYADVISGKIKIKEITDRVKSKRDQDYLRIYGLVPLSRSGPEKDLLSRYTFLQKFKKESRQFGAQKQSSEALAVQIALENLARNAGYPDPLRLSWAMETRQVREVLSKAAEIRDGETVVSLAIDDEGKAEIVVTKGDKTLKSIPPQLKKDKRLIELNDHKKTLKDQFSRSRRSLEEAMVRGDVFSPAELQTLSGHPVISKHLEKLVFVTGKGTGFYREGRLVSAGGVETVIAETDEIRLAHCLDLYRSGQWSAYQRYCFDRQLKQPFKQIFRELYLPTEDELREKSVSRRYAGHQVQPKQTVALLKTRGWKVDYEEGLQKVFHREGFAAKMYAMADWFSPADVESPTLETVVFENLKDYRNRPFAEIEGRIFSEVMRDIDLVVSVAHAGGVDAEASHSSIELRSALLRETARLFKLTNVEVAGNHARVKGSLGEYSVHLGSAVVHKMPGTYLSILPVHSQHRGRLFLPFADDDPKSAEVMSKVLLLARDHEIQDPTILRQLA